MVMLTYGTTVIVTTNDNDDEYLLRNLIFVKTLKARIGEIMTHVWLMNYY